ncbi:TetR/AcrR family transcriptional regulator [Hyphobacterium sp.]|uniref:TetR/AcrR family transcriptional regulator n=1 Tax=Hyphobacterium sp. TaxID=2004662 RepID=UPI003B51C026
MPGQREKQKQETRSRLVSAGAEVFAARGLEGTRISDIAREAGVAMGTLYTHFPDKEALFEEVMRAGKETIIAGIEATYALDVDHETRDRLAMEGVVGFAETHGALFRLLLSRGGGDDPLRREVVDAIATLRVKEFEDGRHSGRIRSGLDYEAAARCEVGAVFHLLDWWLDDPSRMDRQDLIRALSDFRRFGVEGSGA